MEGVSHEAVPRWRARSVSASSSPFLRRQTGSRSTVTSGAGSPTTRRSASKAYGWRVIRDGRRGTTPKRSTRRSGRRWAPGNQPTLVCCKTVIGWGRAPSSPGATTRMARRLAPTRRQRRAPALGWRFGALDIPADLRQQWDAGAAGAIAQQRWERRFDAYAAGHPDLARRVPPPRRRRSGPKASPSGGGPVACRRRRGGRVRWRRARRRNSPIETLAAAAAGAARRLGRPQPDRT